jgi:hypothetical protein
MTANSKQPGEIDTTIPELIKDAAVEFQTVISGPPDAPTLELWDHGNVVSSIPLFQGPPGPAGETIYLHTPEGVRPTPAVRFEIDGWEYSFPTYAAARAVREKLLSMTLEGEL